jgi:NADP-reducing hydrogenase subunit HndB
MKTLQDLQKLRDEAKKRVSMREGDARYRVIVGMATCGIAAGARPVLNALVEACAKEQYDCTVTQTGCIGMCTYEPIVEILDAEGKKTTYIHVDAHKAVEILESHVKNGILLEAYSLK